ncbi:MAG TPA: ATP-binding protein [Syntrophorhabdales bacterium]|nr:ATP-binding protein [Syntrophorhabdales bacterium]
MVALLVGVVSIYTGRQLLHSTVLRQTESRVSLDLNAANRIYQGQIDTIAAAINTAALDNEFSHLISRRDRRKLGLMMRAVAQSNGLDFAGLASADGAIIVTQVRDAPVELSRTSTTNPLVQYVLAHRKGVAGTVVLDGSVLTPENQALAEQARPAFVPTAAATSRRGKEEPEVMAIGAASALFRGKELIGVMYGGQLLNGSVSFVDSVRDAVFQKDTHDGKSVGVTTIFLGDTRISSNALNPGGQRAVGTRVSDKVRNVVLVGGERWSDRAFVVNDWYLTAYEPITDIFGQRVGMLATALLEAKYRDVQQKALTPFMFVTIAGMLVAIAMGFLLSNKIMRPIRALIGASREVSRGNFAPEIGPASRDEIGVLQKTFTEMLSSLQERDERKAMESEIKLLQSEKQASVGRLAAGVAHEINNPLTGVLTFTHMLLRRTDLDEEMKGDLTIIAKATERVRTIVKGLLEFSRETVLAPEATDIDELVASAVKLVENSAFLKGVKLSFVPHRMLPLVKVDKSAMEGVLLNIIMNALDATPRCGSIMVNTGLSLRSIGKKGIEIRITDTGQGIAAENLKKIFEPFFTTKDVGQGTGLGLSVSLGIVERHDGSISVESTIGMGSTFTIWLPLGDDHE